MEFFRTVRAVAFFNGLYSFITAGINEIDSQPFVEVFIWGTIMLPFAVWLVAEILWERHNAKK